MPDVRVPGTATAQPLAVVERAHTPGERPPTSTIVLRLLVAVTCGALLALSYGFQPIWFAAWIAPVPLLVAALTGISSRTAFAMGAVAGAVASASIVGYLSETGNEAGAVVLCVMRALEWALVALLAQRASTRLPVPLAVFVAPLAVAASDLVANLVSDHGAAGSLAYSQLEALPVAQLAALGGAPAVSFAVVLGANLFAYAAARPRRALRHARPLAVTALVLLLAIGLGSWRVADADRRSAGGPLVALVANDALSAATTDAAGAWSVYSGAVAAAARSGADVVVLPDRIATTDAAATRSLLHEVSDVAVREHVVVALGLAETDDDGRVADRMHVVEPDGSVTSVDRDDLGDGARSAFEVGALAAPVDAAGTGTNVLVCTGIGYPQAVRATAAGDVGLLIAPAADHDDDSWLRSRVAMLRGIENGVTVARAASDGHLVLSSPTGAVVAESGSGDWLRTIFAQAPNAGPVMTPFRIVGETFGWMTVVLTALAGIVLLPPRHAASGPPRRAGAR